MIPFFHSLQLENSLQLEKTWPALYTPEAPQLKRRPEVEVTC